MRQRIVIWGTNDKDEKVLLGLDLNARESEVRTVVFPADQTTEEFVNLMMSEWRDEHNVVFPEDYLEFTKELTLTESILPDGYNADKEDILKRAQTEWNFVVMSQKLSDVYEKELEDLRERIDRLEKFEPPIWEELKAFWSKVQDQVHEKNLFRDHADFLRDNTNKLFDRMKELRRAMDHEFRAISEKNKEKFSGILDTIDEKIEKGLGLQPIFEELKRIQQDFRKTKLTRDHRNKIWKRLDGAFKKVKAKRFGDKGTAGSSPLARIKRRYDGLLNAIRKMEKSIKRDENDLDFQDQRIEKTGGQLEMEIRKAKIKMIEERIRSKRNKLSEMMKTKVELEGKIQREEEREAKRKEQEEVEKAKAEIKQQKQAEAREVKEEARAETKENAEEQPKEEQPKEEQPKEEQPKEEQPKEEQPKEEQPKEEQPEEEQPEEEQPEEEQPKEEQPEEEQPEEEQPKEEQPKEEQPEEEQPKEEQPEEEPKVDDKDTSAEAGDKAVPTTHEASSGEADPQTQGKESSFEDEEEANGQTVKPSNRQTEEEESTVDKVMTSVGEGWKDLSDTARAIVTVMKDRLEKKSESIEDLAEAVRDKLEDRIDNIEEVVEAVKDKLEDKAEEFEDAVEAALEKLQKKARKEGVGSSEEE